MNPSEMNITNKLYPQSFYKDHHLSLEDGKLKATSIGLLGRFFNRGPDVEVSKNISELFAQKSRELASAFDHWSSLNQPQREALRKQVVFLRYNADVFGIFYYGKILDLKLEPLEKALGMKSSKVTVQFDNGDSLTVDSKLFEEDCKLFEDLFETISESLVEGNEWNTVSLPLITKEEFEIAITFFNRHQITASDGATKVREFQTAAQLMSVSYGTAVVDYVAENCPDSLFDLFLANPSFWHQSLINSAAWLDSDRGVQLMQKLMQQFLRSNDPQMKEVVIDSLIQMINSSQATLSILGLEEILDALEGASDSALEKLRRLSTGIVDIDQGVHDRIAGLIKRCHNIEELSLAGNGITPRLLENANIPHLRTFELMPILKLTRGLSLPGEGISGFKRNLKSLFRGENELFHDLLDLSRRLHVSSYFFVSPSIRNGSMMIFQYEEYGNGLYDTHIKLEKFDRVMTGFQSFDLLQLQNDTVLWPSITADWIQKLSTSTELRSIRIGGPNPISEQCLTEIGRMSHLKELQLNGETLPQGFLVERIRRMVNLESLVFFFGPLNIDQLIDLAAMPNLSSLVLMDCWGFQDAEIANAGFRDSCKVENYKIQ